MEYKRLKLDDLIKKAGEGTDSKDQYLELYVKSVDATIKLKKPDNALTLESFDLVDGSNDREADLHIVYNSIVEPNIKDTNLHNAYRITRPIEILDKIFKVGEIKNIAKELMKSAGIEDDSVKLVEDIKN